MRSYDYYVAWPDNELYEQCKKEQELRVKVLRSYWRRMALKWIRRIVLIVGAAVALRLLLG